MISKALNRLNQSIGKGNIWLYVLSVLNKCEQYAYVLPDVLDKEFGIKPGKIMMYTVLYKMESEGLITSEYKIRRKYYKVTKLGKTQLKLAKTKLKEISQKL